MRALILPALCGLALTACDLQTETAPVETETPPAPAEQAQTPAEEVTPVEIGSAVQTKQATIDWTQARQDFASRDSVTGRADHRGLDRREQS